jgi:hypothetical protein
MINENLSEYSIALAQKMVHHPLDARHHMPSYLETKADSGDTDVVAYINPDAIRYIKQAGRALKSGFLMTIDYGQSTQALIRRIRLGNSQLHMYGAEKTVGQLSYPYVEVTQHDITTDQDFTQLAQAGSSAGLVLQFYGPQRMIVSGLPMIRQDLMGDRTISLLESKRFFDLEAVQSMFKLLVHEKMGTGAGFSFSGEVQSESLSTPPEKLPPGIAQRAKEIESRLASNLKLPSNGRLGTLSLIFGSLLTLLTFITPYYMTGKIDSVSLSRCA